MVAALLPGAYNLKNRCSGGGRPGPGDRERMSLSSESFRDLAVLVSGGADSAILCVDALSFADCVHPVYVKFGLTWESVELACLERFLHAAARPGLAALRVLEEPVRELYGTHWSATGIEPPGDETPDSAVHLPGRNLLLIAKTAVWCSLASIEAIALGTLAANPFPDTTSEFDRSLEAAIFAGLSTRIRIVRPYQRLSKSDVLKRGAALPLAWTFSCLAPVGGRHCGRCNKCAERMHAFRAAELADPTDYARSTRNDANPTAGEAGGASHVSSRP